MVGKGEFDSLRDDGQLIALLVSRGGLLLVAFVKRLAVNIEQRTLNKTASKE